MRDLAADLRYAWRRLRRTPAFTALAVLTLALGIATSTAFFGIVNSMVLKPIPGVNLEQVFTVGQMPLSGFRLLEDDPPNLILSSVARYSWHSAIHVPGKAKHVSIDVVTAGYAPVFGLRPAAGRWLTREDDRGGARVAVVSHRLWHEWVNGDETRVGRLTIRIGTVPVTVVGVAPEGFLGPSPGFAANTDVWLPLGLWPALLRSASASDFPFGWTDRFGVGVTVRATPGTRPAQLATALEFLREPQPENQRTSRTPIPISEANERLLPARVTSFALMIVGLAALTLAAAGANLTNMLYARGATQSGEVAIRRALGASRGRVMRLFVLETLVIGSLSATSGLVLAAGGLALFGRTVGSLRLTEIRWNAMSLDPSLDYRVFLFTLVVSIVTALAVGLLSSLNLTRRSPLAALAAGAQSAAGERGGWLRTMLVSIQITIALLLVLGAGTVLETNLPQLSRRLHYDTSGVMGTRIDLRLHGYNETEARLFTARVLTAVDDLTRVQAAAFADSVPGGVAPMAPTLSPLVAEPPARGAAGANRRVYAEFSRVSPGFLEMIDLPLLEGRGFQPSDTDGAPLVTIVSRAAAEALWPGQPAIGKLLQLGTGPWITVVGVSADPVTSNERVLGSSRPDARAGESYDPAPFAFVPWAQWLSWNLLVLVRADDVSSLTEPLQAAIRTVDPDLAIFETATIDETFVRWAAPRRAAGILLTTLGAVALAISTMGVYGVIAYFVSRRTREFGLRLALGATPRTLIKMVYDHAVHIVLVGLLPGVFLAAIGSRVLESRVSSLFPNEIRTWVIVPLLILAAGLVAALLPARRASRVDPNVALRDL